MICMSYLEGVEQYIQGHSSDGDSNRMFRQSLERIYPSQFREEDLRRLYSQSRAGLFHDGMVRGDIIISNSFADPIVITDQDIKINEIDAFYDTPIHLVRMVAKGYTQALMFEGEGGLGKTHIILRTLQQENADYHYMRGYTTPFRFYTTLYEHRNKPIIVLDDIEGIFRNDISKSILKATLDTNPESRIIQYNSPRAKNLNIPTQFRPRFRVIVCANSYPNEPDFRAVMDRCMYYPFNFTYEQKLEILSHITRLPYKQMSEEQRREVYNHIRAYSTRATKLSIRTLFKLYDLYLYDRSVWRKLAREIIRDDEDIYAYIKATEKYPKNVSQQVNEFIRISGKSRTTFYRIKKRVK